MIMQGMLSHEPRRRKPIDSMGLAVVLLMGDMVDRGFRLSSTLCL